MARHAFTRGIFFLIINWLLVIGTASVLVMTTISHRSFTEQYDFKFFATTFLLALAISVGTTISWYLVSRLVK